MIFLLNICEVFRDMINSKPQDFGKYWYNVSKELAEIDLAAEIAPIPRHSTEFANAYGVHITSIGPYRLYGYLSIPKGEGTFPARYYVPKNASVLELIPQGSANRIREKYIIFSLACRGMRNSDSPYTAMYPGQLIDGIESAETSVYRGVAADTMRGLDFLSTLPNVDKSAVISIGNDNAILAGALHDLTTHIVCTPAYLHETIAKSSETNSYPLEEFNDYVRRYPDRKDLVEKTLSYFNIKSHAISVTADTLIMADYKGSQYDKKALEGLTDLIVGDVTIHESERSSFKDGLFMEKWVATEVYPDDESPIIPMNWMGNV